MELPVSGEMDPGTPTLINHNSINNLRITKSVRRKWNGKQEIKFSIRNSPSTITGIRQIFGDLAFDELSTDYSLDAYKEDFFGGEHDPDNYVVITVTAETGTYQLVHEIDPLDLLAILGQLGGVFSFVTLAFGTCFVRTNAEMDKRQVNSLIAKLLTFRDTDNAAPAPAGETKVHQGGDV